MEPQIQLTLSQKKALYHDARLKRMLADPRLQALINAVLEKEEDRDRETALSEMATVPLFREFQAALEELLEQHKPQKLYFEQ